MFQFLARTGELWFIMIFNHYLQSCMLLVVPKDNLLITFPWHNQFALWNQYWGDEVGSYVSKNELQELVPVYLLDFQWCTVSFQRPDISIRQEILQFHSVIQTCEFLAIYMEYRESKLKAGYKCPSKKLINPL